jgi:hypothetical protein
MAKSDFRPDEDEIARRAYEIYLQRGSVPGHETDDWLQAEAELAAEHAREEDGAREPKPGRNAPESPARRNGSRREPGASNGRRTLRQ